MLGAIFSSFSSEGVGLGFICLFVCSLGNWKLPSHAILW